MPNLNRMEFLATVAVAAGTAAGQAVFMLPEGWYNGAAGRGTVRAWLNSARQASAGGPR